MLNFRTPVLSDCDYVRSVLSKTGRLGSEACFGNIHMWCSNYGCKIAIEDDTVYFKAVAEDGYSYTLPASVNEDKMVEGVKKLLEEEEKLHFHCLDINQKDFLMKHFPEMFEYEETRDVADYIYEVSKLATLSGKKYHGKRNHISFFENTFDWSYEDMTEENKDECLQFAKYWLVTNGEKMETGTDKEMIAIEKALDAFTALGLKGGILRVQGEIVAFTFGEPINDECFCTHVEKASADIRGAYPMINREFAKNTINNFKFVNREEDLGIPGLRKAKESYRPELLLEKYEATRII